MCLNPTAQEWKPSPAPLQTADQLVTFTCSPHSSMAMASHHFFQHPYFHFHCNYSLQIPHALWSPIPLPLSTIRFLISPAPAIFSTVATPNISVGEEKAPPRVVETKDNPESPPDATKSSTRRSRRAAKKCIPFFPREEQSLLGKFQWRPKLTTSSDAPPPHPQPSPAAATPSQPPSSFLPTTEQNLSSSACSQIMTTVMLKNIPNQFRRDFMLKFLDGLCLEYTMEYDFLYLPMDFRSKDNLGYAFVNLTTGAAAIKMTQILHNYKWGTVHTDNGSITSKKICEVSWAKIQGKEELMKRFQYSCFQCKEMDFLPVILDPPRNGFDPNPSPPLILGSTPLRNW